MYSPQLCIKCYFVEGSYYSSTSNATNDKANLGFFLKHQSYCFGINLVHLSDLTHWFAKISRKIFKGRFHAE